MECAPVPAACFPPAVLVKFTRAVYFLPMAAPRLRHTCLETKELQLKPSP